MYVFSCPSLLKRYRRDVLRLFEVLLHITFLYQDYSTIELRTVLLSWLLVSIIRNTCSADAALN